MSKVRWGIIGIGGIARRRTAPELVKHCRNAELVAVMDVDAGVAQAAAQEFGAPRWYTRVEELLADAAVEAVYVATPNDLHRRQVLAAAAAGKHVLCEKPLALAVPEVEEMVAACREAGVKLGAAYMMRLHPLHRKAHDLLRRGLVGRPVFVRAQLSCWYPPIEGAWRQDPARGGGGALADMGSHLIDLLEYLLDTRVAEVSCFQDRLLHSYEAEDTSVAMLRFANGAVGVVDTCFNLPDNAVRNRLEIYGSDGSLLGEGTIGQEGTGSLRASVSPQHAYDALQRRGEGALGDFDVHADPEPLYASEIDHFSTAIREDTVPFAPGEAGLWNQRVLAVCYESARTGRAVRLG